MITTKDDVLKEKYKNDKEKYHGYHILNRQLLPLMNTEYLTKNNLW